MNAYANKAPLKKQLLFSSQEMNHTSRVWKQLQDGHLSLPAEIWKKWWDINDACGIPQERGIQRREERSERA